MLYRNTYDCPRCALSWIDEWSCACNDRCPTCDLSCSLADSELLDDGEDDQDDRGKCRPSQGKD